MCLSMGHQHHNLYEESGRPRVHESVRSSDHIVVDVANMKEYKGSFMAKADRIKVYVFCQFGYVVCVTDRGLVHGVDQVQRSAQDVKEA